MKVLVANRGEIAVRVLRTLREHGIPSVAVHSEVDAEAPFVWLADERVNLGEPRAYLDIERVVGAAKQTGATAIHPGYGFLAENADFAQACAQAGITFIGPSPEAIRAFGDKREARRLAEENKVPVVPGARACDSVEDAVRLADELGYPVLLKAAGGGGGKGMRKVTQASEVADAFGAASREAQAAFGDARLFIEKYIYPARHVEVQILGDGQRAIALGERECSLQRRYQKVIEEAPSAAITESTRQGLFEAATRLVSALGYSGAGTVEFLVGPDGKYYFLEVNTRLQVEHPITEMLTGLDLVEQQLRIARGEALPPVPAPRGHAIEARFNAEDAYAGFLPATGEVLMLEWPHWPRVRIDAGIVQGSVVSPHYDSMLAKIIAWDETREGARRRLVAALKATTVLGLVTNQTFLIELLERDFFTQGQTFTSTLEEQTWEAPAPPPYVEAIAARELARPAGKAAAGAADTDLYSPFQTLGGFRMGGLAS